MMLRGHCLRRELPLGREFELVCQSLESCVIANSVVSREYHCRPQERVAFSQGCLQPFEAGVCFTQAEIGPRYGQGGAVTLFATHLQLADHVAGFDCLSQHPGKVAKITLAQWQSI